MARESFVLKQRPNGAYELIPREKLSAWIEENYPSKRFKAKQKRVERGAWVVRDGKLVPKHLAPALKRKSGFQIIPDSQPFLNIAVDGGYIGGRRQRRDMIRAHNLIEVGNEPPVNRKTEQPWSTQEFANDIKHAFRQHGVDAL